MSFSQENGYTPKSFDEVMDLVRVAVNDIFQTSYTEQTFIGTGFYKYYYYIVQRISQNETRTAEIFFKLQNYITQVNQRVQRPSVSIEGLIDSFLSNGYEISVKETTQADAGTISICVNVSDDPLINPDFQAQKEEICRLIKDFVVAGMLSLGDQTESITISNGQQFDFSFFLPNRIQGMLRVNIVRSENNLLTVPDDEQIRAVIFENVNTLYKMGWNFEPQRYYNLCSAPWAQSISVQYSLDGGSTWLASVYDATFRDLIEVGLEDIEVTVV